MSEEAAEGPREAPGVGAVHCRVEPLQQDWSAALGRSRPAKRRLFVPVAPGMQPLRRRMNSELNFPPNFQRLVLGYIDADFASKYSLESSRRDLHNVLLCTDL